ncbi:MAG: ribosome maturation factor RimP, partial [Calditrichia bacterium]
KIKALIKPVFEENEVYLVDIHLRGHKNSQVLSLYADTETGITMDQIALLTRQVEDILDLEDPLPGKYRLEVSSPGIDRPLTEMWQFRKNTGRKLQVVYEKDGGTQQAVGILQKTEDDRIWLQLKNDETISLTLPEIQKAVVKINW